MGDVASLTITLLVAAPLGVAVLVAIEQLASWCIPRWTRLAKGRRLRPALAAWTLLVLAGTHWTRSATGTLALSELAIDNFVRAGFLAGAALVVSHILVDAGTPALATLRSAPTSWFLAFGAWSAATLLWTTSPPATAYKTVEYLGTLFVVATTVHLIVAGPSARPSERDRDVKRIFDLQWSLVAASLVAVGVAAAVWPAEGFGPSVGLIPRQLSGVFPAVSSNSVGELGALLTLVSLNRVLAYGSLRGPYWASGALGFSAMLLAQSRSSLLGFALGLLVLLVFHRAWRAIAAAATLGGVIAVTQLNELLLAYLIRGRPGTLVTLTGRRNWWEAAAEAMVDRPLEGFGAFAGGKHVLREAFDRGTSTLHNAFVEAWAGTGAIGAFMFAMAVLITVVALVQARPRRAAPLQARLLWGEAGAVFALLLVRATFSVAFLWPPMTVLAVILVYLTTRSRRRRDEARRAPAVSRLATSRGHDR